MKEWLDKQVQTGFSDLKGLSIDARIPMKDRLVNELLAEALQRRPGASSGPDLRSLLQFVEKAEVSASDGVIALNIVVKI